MMTTLNVLQEQLHRLSQKLGFNYSESEWADLIKRSLKENHLESNEPVPFWIVDFIQLFIDSQETEYIDFERPVDNTNLERRLMSFLDSVVGGDWEFDGETESVSFDQLKMQGIVDHVGSAYYTISY